MKTERTEKYIICDMCKEDTGTYYYKLKVISHELNKSEFELCYNCVDRLKLSLTFLNKHILEEAIRYDLQKQVVEE